MKYQRDGSGAGATANGGGDGAFAAAPAHDAAAAREAAIARAAAEFTPERRAFLEQALAEYTRDHAQRMREIGAALEAGQQQQGGPAAAAAAATAGQQGGGGGGGGAGSGAAAAAAAAPTTTATPTEATTTEHMEELLDELHDIVEDVDHARDLVKVGGLPTLLRLLRDPRASLRWRAADALAASAANNPPVQRWLLDAGAVPPLMALLDLGAEAAAFPQSSAADLVRARTKAVHALSAVSRHHDGGFAAFRAKGGFAQLARLEGLAVAGGDGDEGEMLARRRLLRKELEFLRYALEREPADCEALAAAAAEAEADGGGAGGGGVAERLSAALAESGGASSASCFSDPELRAAALAVLLELAQHPAAWLELRRRCPDLGARLEAEAAAAAAAGGREDGDGDAEAAAAALAASLAARLAPGAPAPTQAKAPRRDHIELDAQEHGSATLPLKQKPAAEAPPAPPAMLSLGAPPPPV